MPSALMYGIEVVCSYVYGAEGAEGNDRDYISRRDEYSER